MKHKTLKNLLCALALTAVYPLVSASHAAPTTNAQPPSGIAQPQESRASTSINGTDATTSPTHHTPTRAVTLTPHITELLFAAGAGDIIVATVTSSDYPPAARSIPRIGDGMNVNVERIIALKPDLVIAWQPAGAAQTLAPTLDRLNIPLIYSQPKTLQDISDQIAQFGQLFGTQAIAAPTAAHLRQRLKTLEERYTTRKPVSVFIEVGTAPLYTIGGDPLLNDALRLCGGINLYAQSALAAPQISTESILVKQPDVIITADIDPAQLQQRRQEWAALHLAAATQGHIYAIDPDALFRPGPRLIGATEELCQYLDQAR